MVLRPCHASPQLNRSSSPAHRCLSSRVSNVHALSRPWALSVPLSIRHRHRTSRHSRLSPLLRSLTLLSTRSARLTAASAPNPLRQLLQFSKRTEPSPSMVQSVSLRKLNTQRERELQSNLRLRARNRLCARPTKHPMLDSDSAVLLSTSALKVSVLVLPRLERALDSLLLTQPQSDQSEQTPTTYTDSFNTVSYLLLRTMLLIHHLSISLSSIDISITHFYS